jgi:hypothetical protein
LEYVWLPFPPPKIKFMVRLQFRHYICWAPSYLERLLEVSFTPKLTTHDPVKTGCSFFLMGGGGTERVHGHHPNRVCHAKPQGYLRGSCTASCPLDNMVHEGSPSPLHWVSLFCHFETDVWSIRFLWCLSKYIFYMVPLAWHPSIIRPFVLSPPPKIICVWQGFSM